jgi:hypothetical protein
MKIIFDRSGGFMGLKFSLTINLDDLPLAQAETLSRLLDEANFFTLTENPPTPPAPDNFQYTITVESDTATRTIRTSDTSAPDELRPLLQELSQRARLRRKA